jgi:hypothetical protein
MLADHREATSPSQVGHIEKDHEAEDDRRERLEEEHPLPALQTPDAM